VPSPASAKLFSAQQQAAILAEEGAGAVEVVEEILQADVRQLALQGPMQAALQSGGDPVGGGLLPWIVCIRFRL
jgi:hypothetical protein